MSIWVSLLLSELCFGVWVCSYISTTVRIVYIGFESHGRWTLNVGIALRCVCVYIAGSGRWSHDSWWCEWHSCSLLTPPPSHTTETFFRLGMFRFPIKVFTGSHLFKVFTQGGFSPFIHSPHYNTPPSAKSGSQVPRPTWEVHVSRGTRLQIR